MTDGLHLSHIYYDMSSYLPYVDLSVSIRAQSLYTNCIYHTNGQYYANIVAAWTASKFALF